MTPPQGPPLVSVIIPSRDRPHLLPDAVDSALGQSVTDLEVVVVDDGSREPIQLPADPRVRILRLRPARGNAAARNAALAAAAGRLLTCLDDDDVLLSDHLETALTALDSPAAAALPKPVGVLTGVAVLASNGEVVEERLPPTLAKGSHFSLEERQPGRSFNTKQSLVVETEVLRGIGGWDAGFRSRTATELFLRLNPVCSLLGVDAVTYHLRRHPGPRVSRDPLLRQRSFAQLESKHRSLFRMHPGRHAELLLDHAVLSARDGRRLAAFLAVAGAARRGPVRTLRWGRQVATRRRPVPGFAHGRRRSAPPVG